MGVAVASYAAPFLFASIAWRSYDRFGAALPYFVGFEVLVAAAAGLGAVLLTGTQASPYRVSVGVVTILIGACLGGVVAMAGIGFGAGGWPVDPLALSVMIFLLLPLTLPAAAIAGHYAHVFDEPRGSEN